MGGLQGGAGVLAPPPETIQGGWEVAKLNVINGEYLDIAKLTNNKIINISSCLPVIQFRNYVC